MAGSALTVHTRVVRARWRADSRASTEPHQRADEPVNETTPYRRDFSPEAEDRTAAHRDSLPYCELAIMTERQATQPDKAASVNLDGTTERDLPPPPELLAESSDVWTVKREKAETSKVSTIKRPQPDTGSVSTVERPQPDTGSVSTVGRPQPDTGSVSTVERPPPATASVSTNFPTVPRPQPATASVATSQRQPLATRKVPTIQRPQPGTAFASTLNREVESSRVSTVDTTSPCAKSDDDLAATAERTRFGRGSGAQPKQGAAVAQPSRDAAGAQPRRVITSATVEDKPPRVAASLSWLGVVVAQPELGAPLVIGTWLCPEFRVTSPVAKIVERDDGLLVQTVTKSRYFVKPAGDAYLVNKAGKPG